ncbi:MAG: hypothetical protein MUD01_06700 [Chloroflexaceae bacterium]|nr:hypothetical protein [Chloroflexaceae bacterium]
MIGAAMTEDGRPVTGDGRAARGLMKMNHAIGDSPRRRASQRQAAPFRATASRAGRPPGA